MIRVSLVISKIALGETFFIVVYLASFLWCLFCCFLELLVSSSDFYHWDGLLFPRAVSVWRLCYHVWQLEHQWVLRPASLIRSIAFPHLGHGCPVRL